VNRTHLNHFVVLGALAGCAHPGAPPPTSEAAPIPAASTTPSESIAKDLARLRALDVFVVEHAIVERPAACEEGDTSSKCEPSTEAREKAARRLAAFTAVAESAVAHPDPKDFFDERVTLQALNDLHVVRAASLVYDNPESAFHCYGPCPPSSAKEKERAKKLATIVRMATDANKAGR
jgi:hypothetical protein